MMTVFSVASLLLSGVFCLIAGIGIRKVNVLPSVRRRRLVACVLLLLGFFVRLFRLTSVPSGLSAEEALVGVQARALLTTGSQAFGSGWPAFFPQWGASQTGSLLSLIVLPFVGVMGLNLLAVRLPLALLSCLSLAAFYGLARRIAGETPGLAALALACVCPYLVQQSHWAMSASAALFLLPVVLYAFARALSSRPWLYAACVLAAAACYGLDMLYLPMFAFVAFFLITGACRTLLRRSDAALGFVLFVVLSLPAGLTLIVNILALSSFTLGPLSIPRFEIFEHAGLQWPSTYGEGVQSGYMALVNVLFQQATSENLTASGFVKPDGYGMAYYMTVPLAVLGVIALSVRHGLRKGDARMLTLRQSIAVLGALIGGFFFLEPNADIFHYALLLPFLLLLAAAGLQEARLRSSVCYTALLSLLAASCIGFFFTFYIHGMPLEVDNTYFSGLPESADAVQNYEADYGESEVYVTTRVYPHENPGAAAEMMTVFAFDLPAGFLKTPDYAKRFHYGLPEGLPPVPNRCYILRSDELIGLDVDAFDVMEFGDFCAAIPLH